MDKKEIAAFTVRVLSAKNSTWQGEVTAGNETYLFQSEIDLVKWLVTKYPALIPEYVGRKK